MLSPLIAPTLALTFSFWGTEAYFRRDEWSKRKAIRKMFSQFVSESLVNHLLKHPNQVDLGGERRNMSYMFTDIADFTTIAENSDPVKLASLINIYLDGLCKIIYKNDGMVIDFIGDADFAVFNAPVLLEDHAMLALKSGREINAFSETFRKSTMAKDFQLGITRIGIHTGPAAVGNMGSVKRLKYTPIGDSVNTASRIEGLNKYVGTKICASVDAINHASEENVRPLGEFKLKGRDTPLKIFEVLTEDDPKAQYLNTYTKAYDSLGNGLDSAKQLFESLLDQQPDDPVVKFHLKRLQDGENGSVITMKLK